MALIGAVLDFYNLLTVSNTYAQVAMALSSDYHVQDVEWHVARSDIPTIDRVFLFFCFFCVPQL